MSNWFLVVLQQYLTETTAHGLGRIVGNRSLALRLFWAASFTALCVLCCLSLHSSLLRLQRQDQKTTFYTENVPFEFPDLFICSIKPFSASFPFNLTEEQSVAMKEAIAQARAAIRDTNVFEIKLKALLHTLPYQLLADTFGHRINQMVIAKLFLGDEMHGTGLDFTTVGNVTEFYHPQHLRCARITFTEDERGRLRQAGNGLQLSLIADSFILEFPHNERTINYTVYGAPVYPPQWSFVDGWNIFGESGLRMFLVQPGTHPADWSTSVLLNPGTATELRISMLQTEYKEDDFPNDCVAKSKLNDVQFDNPYNPEQPYSFSYSYEYCYYSELTHRTQSLLNCTPWRHPKPAQFAQLRSCDNATGMTWEAYSHQLQQKQKLTKEISACVNEVSLLCSKRHSCSSQSYRVQATSVTWPEVASSPSFVAIMKQVFSPFLPQPMPMVNFIFDYAYQSNRLYIDPADVTRLVRTQFTQVRLLAEAEYSTKVQVSIDYTVMNFFAEAGGFLGLYLGCSVLTLGELVELLHNIVATVACRRGDIKVGVGAVANTGAVAAEAAGTKETEEDEAAGTKETEEDEAAGTKEMETQQFTQA